MPQENPAQTKKQKTKQNKTSSVISNCYRVKCQCLTMNYEPLCDLASDYCLFSPHCLIPASPAHPKPHSCPSSCIPSAPLRAHARSMNIITFLIIQVSAQCHLLREFSQLTSRWSAPPYTLQTLCRIFSIITLSLSETIWSIYLLSNLEVLLYNNCRAAHTRLSSCK